MRFHRVLPFIVLAAACAGQAEPRPDDMSAVEHRREAAKERDLADQALREHQRTAARLDGDLPGDPHALLPAEEMRPGWVPMPGSANHTLYVAEARAAHARLHDQAAETLEQLEATECAPVPVAERSACPLLAGAGAVLDVKGGVEVRFQAGAPVDDVYRRMSCHLAFARRRGYAGVADCPLYVKGLRVERDGERVIRILLDGSPKELEELRRHTRELVLPGLPTT